MRLFIILAVFYFKNIPHSLNGLCRPRKILKQIQSFAFYFFPLLQKLQEHKTQFSAEKH